ncbi:c-type cytochrome [Pontibaca salina]|uniref:Cytochrome c n=1 Tax=Pontibaca salina TaxID=2795731 RepID=A0A934HQ38_9RHOB|nr:cytochrome c [Pontibaca salina]MBI6629642.1 cytochrome c [Pontibaca salina]
MRIIAFVAFPALALTLSCAADLMPTAQEGAQVYADNCTACHGPRGAGTGRLTSGQTAPDLTRIADRNGGEFPRARVLSQIDGYGHGKVARDAMPEFGLLLQGESVPVEVDGVMTPTPRPLAALMVFLGSIQKG